MKGHSSQKKVNVSISAKSETLFYFSVWSLIICSLIFLGSILKRGKRNSVSRHLKERSFCVLNILCLFLFVCFVCCIVNLHIWITCEIKWNVLFLILSEFLESSKNQRMCLVTVALKDLDVFVHGRIPEENVEISSPHPQSSALILWTRLAHSLVANQTMFKGWGRGGDYWHEEEASRMKWYNHA